MISDKKAELNLNLPSIKIGGRKENENGKKNHPINHPNASFNVIWGQQLAGSRGIQRGSTAESHYRR
jgi:hypothetical protein